MHILAVSTPAHADTGLITLLQTFDFPGLELELNGIWYQVPNIPDCLVVNIGEVLTIMSNGRFKSTIHRVIDIDKDRYTKILVFTLVAFHTTLRIENIFRYSMPFFFEPPLDMDMNNKVPEKLLLTPKEAKMEDNEYVSYGTFIFKKLHIYTEWSTLFQNLPKWMIDKYVNKKCKIPQWAEKSKVEIDGQLVVGTSDE